MESRVLLLVLSVCAGLQSAEPAHDLGSRLYHLKLEGARDAAVPTLEDLGLALDLYESKDIASGYVAGNERLGHKQFLVTYTHQNDVASDDRIHVIFPSNIARLTVGTAVGNINGNKYMIESIVKTENREYAYVVLRQEISEFRDVIYLHNELKGEDFPCAIYQEDVDGTVHAHIKISPTDEERPIFECNDIMFLRGGYHLVTGVEQSDATNSDRVAVKLMPIAKTEFNNVMFSSVGGTYFAYRIFAQEDDNKIVYAYVKIPASDPYIIPYNNIMDLNGIGYVVTGIQKCSKEDNVSDCISIRFERLEEDIE